MLTVDHANRRKRIGILMKVAINPGLVVLLTASWAAQRTDVVRMSEFLRMFLIFFINKIIHKRYSTF